MRSMVQCCDTDSRTCMVGKSGSRPAGARDPIVTVLLESTSCSQGTDILIGPG